jgi:hypothetical protein
VKLGWFLIFVAVAWWAFFDPWLRHRPKYLAASTQHFVLIAMVGFFVFLIWGLLKM